MAYSTISKPSLYFNTKLYTGNSSTQEITGVGFQPDWVWIKRRDASAGHKLTDAVRGVNKQLISNNSNAQNSDTNILTAFGSDGFTLGNSTDVNNNTSPNVAWNWKANGAGSSNSDGSVSATLSANATAGFSISTFTTSGSGTFTVGHGLGVAPKMIIYRPTGSSSWQVGHNSIGWTNFLALNNTGASASNTAFGNTAPTTSVWTGNTANVGANAPCVAYCFADVTGYSKFGSYTGNDNADGTFVYTGFKPAWIIRKNIDGGITESWFMEDNKRNTFNPANEWLAADASSAEGANNFDTDFLSNGFKMRSNNHGTNKGSTNYIYMAIAEEPLVANVGASIPATAR